MLLTLKRLNGFLLKALCPLEGCATCSTSQAATKNDVCIVRLSAFGYAESHLLDLWRNVTMLYVWTNGGMGDLNSANLF